VLDFIGFFGVSRQYLCRLLDYRLDGRILTSNSVGPDEDEIQAIEVDPAAPGGLAVRPTVAMAARRLAEDTQKAAALLAESSISEGTRRAYATDWKRFVEWCSERGVQPAEASTAVVATFLAWEADTGLRMTSIERSLSAVLYTQKRLGRDLRWGDRPIPDTLEALRRRLGTEVRKKQPLTAERLRMVLPHLRGSLERALVLLGVLLGVRRSELVALDVGDLTFQLPEGLAVLLEGRRADGSIKRAKTNQTGKERRVAVHLQPAQELCAVTAVSEWLVEREELVASLKISTDALFVRVPKLGPRRAGRPVRAGTRLAAGEVAQIIQRACGLAGLEASDFGGHSLRAGLVTEARRQRLPDDVVMAQTGHRDRRILDGYDRRDPQRLFENNVTKDLFKR